MARLERRIYFGRGRIGIFVRIQFDEAVIARLLTGSIAGKRRDVRSKKGAHAAEFYRQPVRFSNHFRHRLGPDKQFLPVPDAQNAKGILTPLPTFLSKFSRFRPELRFLTRLVDQNPRCFHD